MFRDYALVIAFAIGLAILIRVMVFEAYRIPTFTMKPTLVPGDLILVNKLPSTLNKKLSYGSIVIYRPESGLEVDYVKRVVGLPGDRVRVLQGHLWINDKEVPFVPGADGVCGQETHPHAPRPYSICLEPPLLDDYPGTTVDQGQYFLLADYRQKGSSKVPWDFVKLSQVRGIALWIWLSIEPDQSRAEFFSRIRFDRIFQSL